MCDMNKKELFTKICEAASISPKEVNDLKSVIPVQSSNSALKQNAAARKGFIKVLNAFNDDKIKEDDMREFLRFAYDPLLKSIVKEHDNASLSAEDLTDAGLKGLIEAARKYNNGLGFTFTSYATWWIRYGMFRLIRSVNQ